MVEFGGTTLRRGAIPSNLRGVRGTATGAVDARPRRGRYSSIVNHRPQSRREELANALTHGAALAASLVGLPPLIWMASLQGDTRNIVACSVFGVTLVILYAASTIYHALPICRAKHVARIIDHIAIYFLIAGSYTPFALGVLRGTWGWTLFGIVWALAALGVLHKTLLGFRMPRLSTFMYLGMGWLAIVAIGPFSRALPLTALALIFGGGLAYSVGVVLYVRDHLPYRHALWHVFVVAGSVLHYAAVLLYATGPLRQAGVAP
jgi:hemolysin III